LSAQPNLSVLCRRLLAALSLVVAATLAASAPGFGGRPDLQNANAVDRTVLSGLGGLIEDERRQKPDTAAGGPRIEAETSVALLRAVEPAGNGRPPLHVSGAPATYAARAGLTRAPPLS
jgi:hypothetical protein